ncbi:MAG: hypothetical protein HQM01_11240 [Magnetococcales bacterium]|nr:hypothetical protein [Magnetococcales bacterium]
MALVGSARADTGAGWVGAGRGGTGTGWVGAGRGGTGTGCGPRVGISLAGGFARVGRESKRETGSGAAVGSGSGAAVGSGATVGSGSGDTGGSGSGDTVGSGGAMLGSDSCPRAFHWSQGGANRRTSTHVRVPPADSTATGSGADAADSGSTSERIQGLSGYFGFGVGFTEIFKPA